MILKFYSVERLCCLHNTIAQSESSDLRLVSHSASNIIRTPTRGSPCRGVLIINLVADLPPSVYSIPPYTDRLHPTCSCVGNNPSTYDRHDKTDRPGQNPPRVDKQKQGC